MKMAVQGRSKSWINHFFNVLSLFYVISMGVLAAYVYGQYVCLCVCPCTCVYVSGVCRG